MSQLITYNFNLTDPDETAALTTGAIYWVIPFAITIVHVSAAPYEDDAGMTIDIQDDGTDIITALACADKDVPGTWSSTHTGGTNAPVTAAAGSEMTIDVNAAAAANLLHVTITALVGELKA